MKTEDKDKENEQKLDPETLNLPLKFYYRMLIAAESSGEQISLPKINLKYHTVKISIPNKH